MTRNDETVSFWRSAGIALLCWTGMALLQGRLLFVSDREQGIYLPYAHYFVWVSAETLGWVVVTPLVFLFSRRYPFQRHRWFLRTVQYGFLLVGVILTQIALESPAWFYKPDQHQPYLRTMENLGRKGMIGGVQVCFLLFLLSAYQNTKREARQRALREAELESRISTAELHMLRMQLHPHFLFNTLQAAMVLIRENPDAAENVLQRLSELLRVALDDMRSLQVPLGQEITFLEHYVEIQKQRFQERLTVRFEITEDALTVPVPTLLLQPLVENAIHHGIGRHKGNDLVEVTGRRRGPELVLEIRNFTSSLLEEPDGSGHGVGLKNSRARLEQMYGDQATLELSALSPRGVCTTVTLPVESAA